MTATARGRKARLLGSFSRGIERYALAQQEEVRYVVSPNYKHVKFEPQWGHAFPQAENVGLAVQAAMKPNVPSTGEMPCWHATTQQQQE